MNDRETSEDSERKQRVDKGAFRRARTFGRRRRRLRRTAEPVLLRSKVQKNKK